jgi:hypothetical protein
MEVNRVAVSVAQTGLTETHGEKSQRYFTVFHGLSVTISDAKPRKQVSLSIVYKGVSRRFRTQSIKKYTLTTINTS